MVIDGHSRAIFSIIFDLKLPGLWHVTEHIWNGRGHTCVDDDLATPRLRNYPHDNQEGRGTQH